MDLLVQGLAHGRPSIIVGIIITTTCHGPWVFWSIQNVVPVIEVSSCNSCINTSNWVGVGGSFLPYSEIQWFINGSDNDKKKVP